MSPSAAELDLAVATLVDPSLASIVEMVLTRRDGAYEAHAVDGSVRFRRHDPAAAPDGSPGPARDWSFTVDAVTVRDPSGTVRRTACRTRRRARRPVPRRAANAYPFAFEQVAQLFDHPHAPDLCVVHTASHHWAEQGGHIGEHGSLGAVQSRAPFLISGPGARSDGLVAGPVAQMVDIAPTVLALLGVDPSTLAGADGRPIDAVLDRAALDRGDGPRHVVGFLLDGCNPNVLYDSVARE